MQQERIIELLKTNQHFYVKDNGIFLIKYLVDIPEGRMRLEKLVQNGPLEEFHIRDEQTKHLYLCYTPTVRDFFLTANTKEERKGKEKGKKKEGKSKKETKEKGKKKEKSTKKENTKKEEKKKKKSSESSESVDSTASSEERERHKKSGKKQRDKEGLRKRHAHQDSSSYSCRSEDSPPAHRVRKTSNLVDPMRAKKEHEKKKPRKPLMHSHGSTRKHSRPSTYLRDAQNKDADSDGVKIEVIENAPITTDMRKEVKKEIWDK